MIRLNTVHSTHECVYFETKWKATLNLASIERLIEAIDSVVQLINKNVIHV